MVVRLLYLCSTGGVFNNDTGYRHDEIFSLLSYYWDIRTCCKFNRLFKNNGNSF